MQIERSVATSTKPKRRPSYINLSTASSCSDALLSPRTPKSISKSRRSSVVQELLSDSRASSRRNSLANSQSNTSQPPLTPVLLSDSTTSFFQDLALQDDNDSHSSDPRHLSVDDDSIHSSGRPRSSSVTSIITATGATSAPLPSFDVHTLYKIKTTRSSRKLDHFFGETAPHDICIKEIRKEGIKAMLQSKIPLCYFLFHLLEEYSSENLFFFIEIEQYESFAYTSIVQQLATAQHIYNTYLTSKSFFEVNLDDKVRRDVTGALQRKDLDGCFNSAKRAVYTLLESSYMRFLSTDSFQQMVKHCGEHTTHYDETSRHTAVDLLLHYLEKQHAVIYTNPHTDSPVFMTTGQSSRRRYELVKSMIHQFCRTLIGVEFNYYRPEPSMNGCVDELISTSNDKSIEQLSPRSKQRHINFFGKKK